MQFRKKDFFTIPNIMSYFRILCVPAFVIVYLNAQSLAGHIWAIVIVAISALTDVFDGRVARKTGQVTDVGKILDPLADKLMQFAMLFCVVFKYHWVLVLLIIFVAKELISLAFSGYLFTKKKNIGGAMWCGKLCTVILYAVMLAFLIFPISSPIDTILIGFSAAFMLLAFVVYMNAYIILLIEYKNEQKAAKKADQK